MADFDLMSLLAAGSDPRMRFQQMLLEPEPDTPTASPEPISRGQSLLLALSDAAQTYGRGLNRNVPPGTAQMRLLQRREQQAQRDATSQRQKQRRDFLGKQSAARAGLDTLDRREGMAQQQQQFEAGQIAADERLEKQLTHAETLEDKRNAANIERDKLRMTDPNAAKEVEAARGQAAGLANMFIFGDQQAGMEAMKTRLEGGESAEDILYQFERRLLELPNLTKAEYDYAMADFQKALAKFAPAPVVDPPNLGQSLTPHQAIQPTGDSLWDSLSQALTRPAFFKR